MPNTLISVFVSSPATEPVEAPHPNTGVYVLGTQATAGGPWTVTHTLVTKTTTPLTMVGRLKNFPAVTVSVVASGGPFAGNIFNTVLTAPTGLAVTPTSSSVIGASWNTVANASGYLLERATNSTFTTGLTTVYAGPLLSFSNTGLTASTGYYYRVSTTGTGFYDSSGPSAGLLATTSAATAATVYDMTAAGIFGHTITDIDSGAGYRIRSGLAVSPTVQTNAASLTVRLAAPIMNLGNPVYSGNRARVAVFVDGALSGSITATQAAAADYSYALPNDGATHSVYFVEGLAMYLTASTFAGTYLVTVTVPSGSTASLVAFVRPTRRIALSTDSILEGDHATNPGATSIIPKMRALYPAWEIADIGFCGRTCTYALDTDALQNAEVAAIDAWMVGATEKVVALQLGANDANQSLNVQGYQTRVSLITAKHHTSDATKKVALIQPFYSTLLDGNTALSPAYSAYRTAMQSVVNLYPNYCRTIATAADITSANAATYLDDGLHMNDVGHAYEAPLLGQRLTSLPVNAVDAVTSSTYNALSYGRIFSTLNAGTLNTQDTWNQNSGQYTVGANGLTINSEYNANPVGILFAKQTYGDHRVLLRVSRDLDPRAFMVVHHQGGTLTGAKTGFWITGTVDERYDSGVAIGNTPAVGTASVTPFTPAIAGEIPLNRSPEFWMEAETIGSTINYRSWVGDAVTNRPNSPQSTRTLPASVTPAGYVGLLTTGVANVLIKEMRIYIA